MKPQTLGKILIVIGLAFFGSMIWSAYSLNSSLVDAIRFILNYLQGFSFLFVLTGLILYYMRGKSES